jgi:hypothetical protein
MNKKFEKFAAKMTILFAGEGGWWLPGTAWERWLLASVASLCPRSGHRRGADDEWITGHFPITRRMSPLVKEFSGCCVKGP